MSLTDEVHGQYVRIIDGILAVADLNTISEKKIRKGIQEAVNYDITPHKTAIKELIMQRFDEFHARQKDSNGAAVETDAMAQPPTPPTTNGYAAHSPSVSPVKRQSESEETSDIVADCPPKKKVKKETLDDDAAMAARLQAEENARARPTRGGGPRKSTTIKKKKTPRKKTSDKIRAEDDSDIESSDVAEKPERNTGFHKPLLLSAALSALLDGETQMSRPQAVKRLWAHIKANDLQDPKDKRQIICDDQMRAVFKQDKVHMFTMTKLLNQNLYSPDE